MREYEKMIIYSVVFVVIVVAITLLMTNDVNLFFFNNLSITSVDQVKQETDALIESKQKEEQNYTEAKEKLANSKNSFDVAKAEYESIDAETIKQVQEATKEEKYFIEYLWIVLGDYAKTNNVIIDIITPGATVVEKTETTEEDTETKDTTKKATTDATKDAATATITEATQPKVPIRDTLIDNSTSNANKLTDTQDVKGTTKLTVTGRYADVADFVFDVENDSSLKFKLDNIKMTYSKDNLIVASFDVLSLSVSK